MLSKLSFKKLYYSLLVIFVLQNLILFLSLQPFIYTLCGYNPKLFSRLTAEAFEAYKNTEPARKLFFKILISVVILTALLSLLAIWLRIQPKIVSLLVIGGCVLLLLLFFFVIYMRGLEGLEVLSLSLF